MNISRQSSGNCFKKYIKKENDVTFFGLEAEMLFGATFLFLSLSLSIWPRLQQEG